ncbi:MAG: recombinase family protein, partial [Planctomycetaceae bacterium]|nr:recombinase family protein [Planctomycetaceae bacterium]
DAYAHLAPLVARWEAEGLSHRRIAARLDAAGYATRSGKPWNHTQVSRVLKYSAY